MTSLRTRLAPSPTGALHLGNICTFILNWVIAKQNNWEIVLRIEDIDGPRKKSGMIEDTVDILQWIGIDWDGPITIQSENLKASYSLLEELIKNDSIYHCQLSRKELEQVLSAPHDETKSTYPNCRPHDIKSHNMKLGQEPTNWRFAASDSPHIVTDEIRGKKTFSDVQDFVVWTKDNKPAYQLAVVADDHRQQITDVVRGNDLFQSAAWQEQLYWAMGWAAPRWHHLPLVLGEDGKRLAKRHGDSRISTYRSRGVSPERIIGLIAMWTISKQNRNPMTLEEFANTFDVQLVSTTDFIFTREDEAWLLE